jgi:GNAT superfamily N-acetyltransferase
MLTFQVEKFAQFELDLRPIIPLHYEELALNKDRIKLDLDFRRYERIEQERQMLIATVRDDGRLVGYSVELVLPHLHYQNAGLMAWTDIYFVLPQYRNGTGARLIAFAERKLRELGVVKSYRSCKAHQDHTRLFEAMGYRHSDLVFTKML